MNATSLELLIADLRTRKASSPHSIALADGYLKSLGSCLSGGSALSQIATVEQWQKELADAANRLTYCGLPNADDADLMQKSVRDGAGIAGGAILEYDCILSSRRKDRDGDILEQAGGMELDLKMPLLWQHIQLQPIGKHVKLLAQDEHFTKCTFAIADIPLGRDAATLVKMGALRKSHGFKALDLEPVAIVKASDGKEYVQGWHVKKSHVMEGSLVSIPANADTGVLAYYEKEFDAIATAYSRKSLVTDIVKHWAKGIYDQRPVQVPGATLSTKGAADYGHCPDCGAPGEKKERRVDGNTTCANGHTHPHEKFYKAASPAPAPLATKGDGGKHKCGGCSTAFDLTDVPDGVDLANLKCPACGAAMSGGKSVAAPLETKSLTLKAVDLDTKAVEYYIPGSFEWITSKLHDSASRYLRDKNVLTEYGYAWVYATLPTAVVVCTGSSNGNKCYRIDWAMDGDLPKLSGDPVEVDVQPAVIEKRIGDLRTKAASIVPPEQPKNLKQMSRELIAKAILADGDEGLKALAACEDAAKTIRSQQTASELADLMG